MSAKTINGYLVYRAHDETLRFVKQSPRLAWDEIAFTVKVNVPDPWGRLAGAIVVDLPENGPPHIEVAVDPLTPGLDTDA